MLVSKAVSKSFLEKYKKLMTYLNDGIEPDGVSEYVSFRELLFEKLDEKKNTFVKLVGNGFYDGLKSARFGDYIYLKKYRNGYVFNGVDDDLYYQASALTTSLEEIIEEYSVIETALIPYRNCLICDGLIVNRGVLIGKNMAKGLRDGYWAAKRSGQLVTNLSIASA